MFKWLFKHIILEPPPPTLDIDLVRSAESQNPYLNIQFPPDFPDDGRRAFQVIEQHASHPLVKEHFEQVSIITMIIPDRGQTTMYLPDFRDGQYAALIWDDVDGTWGSGGWLRLAHPGADVTCQPSEFGDDYLFDTPGYPDVPSLLDSLYATRPSANAT